MVLKHREAFKRMFASARTVPMHGRALSREEVRVEGLMKANSLVGLLCSLEFMKEKGLDVKEYYDYLGQKIAATWDNVVFFETEKKTRKGEMRMGAHGLLKTMVLMFEGMLCNFDESLGHNLQMSLGGKESTLTMECVGAAALKKFAGLNLKIGVDELCPSCMAIVEPIAARLGMEIKRERRPDEKCQWIVKERE